MSDPAHPMALPRPLRGPTSHVYWVNFHPSGSLITAASTDGTIRLWETDPQRAAEAIGSTMGEPITRAEWEQYLSSIPYHPPC
ncbi:hypothetical protein AB0C22_25840 [Micromonospora sp. NPDC048894]|uniref:hypothetical protein n=1 Tax=unclassified Micromonospora TaxID=2617518 RepID=UPI0033E08912